MKKMDFPDMKFSLYFLGFVGEDEIPQDEKERTRWCFSQRATLEVLSIQFNLIQHEIFLAHPQLGDGERGWTFSLSQW